MQDLIEKCGLLCASCAGVMGFLSTEQVEQWFGSLSVVASAFYIFFKIFIKIENWLEFRAIRKKYFKKHLERLKNGNGKRDKQ